MGEALHRATPTLLAVTLSMITLTACSAFPSEPTKGAWLRVDGEERTVLLPPEVNHFLSTAPAGSDMPVEHSPWGDHVKIQADSSYYAASGRTCRHLWIHRHRRHSPQPALACRNRENQWEKVRVLTHSASRIGETPSAPSSPQLNVPDPAEKESVE